MRAEEARKFKDAYDAYSDITFILMAIRSAAQAGEGQLVTTSPIRKGQQEALRQLGYRIIDHNTIAW